MGDTFYEFQCEENSVKLWTEARIPFMPKDSLLALRKALRKELHGLMPMSGHALKAEFVSDSNEFFDVENVLIYNIGTSTFKGFTDYGLQVIRDYSIPVVSPEGKRYKYLYKYYFAPLPKSPPGPPSISFPLANLSSGMKPHLVWWAMCGSRGAVASKITGSFRLYIQAPSVSSNFTNVVKPLIDGIICGMHNPSDIDDLAMLRLAEATGWTRSEIENNLKNPPLPILKPRKILSTYRDFVKWDPEDELCEEFIVTRSNGDGQCRVWVENIETAT